MTRLLSLAIVLLLSLHATAQGTQFITGPCTSDTDCASSCCGFNSGKCAGPVVAQERDGGCGFGNAAPNNNAAVALTGGAASAPAQAAQAAPAASQTPSAAGAEQKGTQFITGVCMADKDCASACCAFKTGKCAAPAVAKESGGCGFGESGPNDNAFNALKALQRRVVVW